eukprot:5882331-Amphidinium_carterae.1
MVMLLILLLLTTVIAIFCALYSIVSLGKLAEELKVARHEACQPNGTELATLQDIVGVDALRERLGQVEILLRIAGRESPFGYGYGDVSRGMGSGRSPYDYGGRYDDLGAGYESMGGGLFGGSAAASPGSTASKDTAATAKERELANLPTTRYLSCRTPRCDRNATTCKHGVPRSLASPYGCCSDYMLIMLRDVTSWLGQRNIPYFITYGTLLGALREGDVLPYTQDIDIVVDRSHWVELQRGLEGTEFFGGRRYLFGVDQWESKVSRICADWDGFAPSVIGGQENDRLSRSADFHLDVYASDWWQITDLHLVDCVEPLGMTTLAIRELNFSAPARPRACVEKLYGAEWRTPKHALAGVN